MVFFLSSRHSLNVLLRFLFTKIADCITEEKIASFTDVHKHFFPEDPRLGSVCQC